MLSAILGEKKKEGEENAVVYSLEYCRGSIAQGTFVSNNGLDSVGVEAVAKKVLVCMDLSHKPYVALGPPAKPPNSLPIVHSLWWSNLDRLPSFSKGFQCHDVNCLVSVML